MSDGTRYWDQLAEEFGGGWNRFWFTPRSGITLGRLRIATGVLTIAFLHSWSNQLVSLFASDGLLPAGMTTELLTAQNRHLFHISPLFALQTPAALWTFHVMALAVAVLFTAGVFTRVTTILALLAVLSYVQRAPLLTGPFESVLVYLLFYLAIGPACENYSFDAWRATGAFRGRSEPYWLSGIALRLMQVHLAMFTLLVACSALSAPVWWNGTAVWIMEAQTLSRPLDLSVLHDYPKLMNLWTHLFVLSNLLLPMLVWNRLLRPLVIGFAVIMWLSVIPISGQVLYPLALITGMYAFLDKEIPDSTARGELSSLPKTV